MADLTEPSFSSALAAWRDIDLAALQKTLDSQGLEIVESQKESLVGRKRLAEQTREFKKNADEDKSAAFKTLLKAYQSEIDALTKRCKASENAFLNVYKLLAEAPDPFPLLDAAVDQTARAYEAKLLESELKRQKDDNAALKSQLADAHALDKDRKKLQDKVDKFEAKMEEMVTDKVAAKEAELHAEYDERIRNHEDREADLSKQVATHKSQLRDLRTSNESTQARLLDQGHRLDQESGARLAEMDIVTKDLERATARVAEVERRNEKLRAEIEAVRSGSESVERVKTLEDQITELQSEATRLLRNLDTQKEEAMSTKQSLSKRISDKERDISNKDAEIDSLRTRLRQYSDYDELKRELDIMKYVEFAGLDMDGGEDSIMSMPDPNADKANRHHGKPLETLLVEKNRKLQDEVTGLRVAHEEVQSSFSTAQSELQALQSRFDQLKTLNDRLEGDLLKMHGGQNAPDRGSPALTPSVARSDPLANLNIGKKETPAVETPNSAETSILPIITSQRDRFRQRNGELEEELRRQFETITELRSEIKNLQADNLKLYEKVRYLQSYRDDTGPASLRNLARRDEDLGKYKSIYEQSMNPFEAFRGKEHNRAVQRLNPIEKVLLSLANLILSNRIMRTVFVIYAIGLHVFVFAGLWDQTVNYQVTKIEKPPI